MSFPINRRLLKNNCIVFFILLFILESNYITFFHINPSKTPLPVGIFDHLQPFYHSISCQKLFESDPDELKHALTLLSDLKHPTGISDESYRISEEQCHDYRSKRFNETFHRQDTSANQQFPLAFSILMYENVEQFERLLRVIYRPQNFYCIHVDHDASSKVFESVQSLARCFENVFLSSQREIVLYTTFSRLQADLNCMKDLSRYPTWKYVLNMANTELPLKTNSELVKILPIYRGYNDIEGRWKTRNVQRTEFVWKVISNVSASHAVHLERTNEKKKPPPGNVEIVKGSAYGAFSRAFIEFIQTSSIAKELLDWSRDTYSPDEHYWATLNYNTHLHPPGGYKAKSDPTHWTARFVNWGEQNCYGRIVRGICVFGTVDLPTLADRHELFANKFQLDGDPIAYQCLEELLLNRSQVDLPLSDAVFYRRMPFLLPS